MKALYVNNSRGLRQRQDGLLWTTLGADALNLGFGAATNLSVDVYAQTPGAID